MDKQIISIKAHNETADYVYSKLNKNDWINIEGKLEKDSVVIANVNCL